MKFSLQFIITFSSLFSWIYPAPQGEYKFCGTDLTKVMAEACNGSYYGNFKDDDQKLNRRTKRGIVDECCKRYCSWSTLQSYCAHSNSSTNSKTDLIAVRKRNGMLEDLNSRTNGTRFTYALPIISRDMPPFHGRHQKRKLFAHSESDAVTQQDNKRLHTQYRSKSPSYVNNKVKRNGSPSTVVQTEGKYNSKAIKDLSKKNEVDEALNKEASIKHIRHPRTHITPRMIKFKERAQVGTISPYFLRRTLVLSSSSHNAKQL